MISHWRTTTILLFCSLVFSACTKDPAIEPISIEVCTEYIPPVSIDNDTLTVHYTSYVAVRGVKFQPQYLSSLYLRTDTREFVADGTNQLDITVEMDGVLDDSTGVFQPQWLAENAPRSFQLGDTLSPFTELHASRYLYFNNTQTGVVSVSPPLIWYVGFVRIINGAKHVGYIRIGTSSSVPQRYWIEDVRLAECPGTPIVITE